MWHFLLRENATWINYFEDRMPNFYLRLHTCINYFEDTMPNFYFRLHEVPVTERNYHNNQTWINYFEDRMHNFYFRLHEVPVRERNCHNNQIELNIMHKEFLFIHHIYQTLAIFFIILILSNINIITANIITGYY